MKENAQKLVEKVSRMFVMGVMNYRAYYLDPDIICNFQQDH